MKKIEKRDFEICSENGIVVIVCMISMDESTKKCLDDIDSLNLEKYYIRS